MRATHDGGVAALAGRLGLGGLEGSHCRGRGGSATENECGGGGVRDGMEEMRKTQDGDGWCAGDGAVWVWVRVRVVGAGDEVVGWGGGLVLAVLAVLAGGESKARMPSGGSGPSALS